MPEFEHDLLVIGAGSGGVAASRRAALHGARVAIVEAGRVGGTCVLRGCVPKKLLMYAAEFGEGLETARGYGWHFESAPRFEMPRWAAAKAAETSRLEGIYRQMLAGAGVELVEGAACFVAPHRVQVQLRAGGTRELSAAQVIVATGGAAVRDSVPGIEACATSDDLLDLQALPASAAVVGGGYIAVEFASMLVRLGVRVSLFFRDRLPLRGFDPMLRDAAAGALAAAGVELNAGRVPVRIRPRAGGGTGFVLQFADERLREFEWVLNATGRRPVTAGLGLAAAGIGAGARGEIRVDDALATARAGHHAIGDVTDRHNLTPVAIAEGRALADRLFGPPPLRDRRVDLSIVPSAVFMLPPLATAGPGEAALVAAGTAHHVYETDFRPMKTAFVGAAARTRMKLLVEARPGAAPAAGRVLAVHMAGPDAPEIVQSLAVALSAGASKADFDRTLAMHPTAAEEFVLMREPARSFAAAGAPPLS